MAGTEKRQTEAALALKAAEQFNGREGETATLLSRCPLNFSGLGGGFAPRHLKRWATHSSLEHSRMRQRRPEMALSASEIEFADAYLDLENPEAHDWATDVLFRADTSEELLRLVMLVIQRAHLPKDEEALSLLGAGPMEDLMGDWLLDRLKDYLPFTHELRCCLSGVRMDVEPEALQERLLRMRGVH